MKNEEEMKNNKVSTFLQSKLVTTFKLTALKFTSIKLKTLKLYLNRVTLLASISQIDKSFA